MGRKVVYLPTCHSTNDYAFELLRKSDIESGTIVITDHQTSGKGQRGNTWLAEPGKNITCSIIYRPLNMPAAEQFRLNIILSVAIFNVLGKRALPKLKIKWPNDVLVDQKKICGILPEIFMNHLIIGVGINFSENHNILNDNSREYISNLILIEFHRLIFEIIQSLYKILDEFFESGEFTENFIKFKIIPKVDTRS